jgi:hypothetical protein
MNDYITVVAHGKLASMAEWSKAVRSGRILFGGVGSNPTRCMLPFLPMLLSTPIALERRS